MANLEHHYIEETPTEARAAYSGRLVLYGLMFSTLAAFAVIYLYSLS